METINIECVSYKRTQIGMTLPAFVAYVNCFHLNSIPLIMNPETGTRTHSAECKLLCSTSSCVLVRVHEFELRSSD